MHWKKVISKENVERFRKGYQSKNPVGTGFYTAYPESPLHCVGDYCLKLPYFVWDHFYEIDGRLHIDRYINMPEKEEKDGQ